MKPSRTRWRPIQTNMPVPSVLQIRTAQVVRVHRVTPELFTLDVVLPAEERFAFQAGQWVYLHLLNEAGEPVARGAFSMASAPGEAVEVLSFGIKIYGRLTAAFAELGVGDRIGVQGPFGVFTLPQEDVPLLMLAGGIGITPMRSLITEAQKSGRVAPIALIWTSKTREDLLYHQDFQSLAQESQGRFLYLPTLTRDVHPDWTGWRGRLDGEKLGVLALDWQTLHAYVCGPELYMSQAKQLLQERGITGKPRLHEEKF